MAKQKNNQDLVTLEGDCTPNLHKLARDFFTEDPSVGLWPLHHTTMEHNKGQYAWL